MIQQVLTVIEADDKQSQRTATGAISAAVTRWLTYPASDELPDIRRLRADEVDELHAEFCERMWALTTRVTNPVGTTDAESPTFMRGVLKNVVRDILRRRAAEKHRRHLVEKHAWTINALDSDRDSDPDVCLSAMEIISDAIHVLFVDGREHTARQWVDYFSANGEMPSRGATIAFRHALISVASIRSASTSGLRPSLCEQLVKKISSGSKRRFKISEFAAEARALSRTAGVQAEAINVIKHAEDRHEGVEHPGNAPRPILLRRWSSVFPFEQADKAFKDLENCFGPPYYLGRWMVSNDNGQDDDLARALREAGRILLGVEMSRAGARITDQTIVILVDMNVLGRRPDVVASQRRSTVQSCYVARHRYRSLLRKLDLVAVVRSARAMTPELGRGLRISSSITYKAPLEPRGSRARRGEVWSTDATRASNGDKLGDTGQLRRSARIVAGRARVGVSGVDNSLPLQGRVCSSQGHIARFYQYYAELIAEFVDRYRCDPQLRDDVRQEVLVCAIERMRAGSFESGHSRFSYWLERTVSSKCRELECERMAQTPRVCLDSGSARQRVVDSHAAPDDLIDERETSLLVRRAMADLSDEDRKLINLRHVDGRSINDIAEEMSMQVSVVRRRIACASTALRRSLLNQCVSDPQ